MQETVAVVFLEEKCGGNKDLCVLLKFLLCESKIFIIKIRLNTESFNDWSHREKSYSKVSGIYKKKTAGFVCPNRHHLCPYVAHYISSKPLAIPRINYASLNFFAFVLLPLWNALSKLIYHKLLLSFKT